MSEYTLHLCDFAESEISLDEDCTLSFVGNGSAAAITLNHEQMQAVADLLGDWGYQPAFVRSGE